MNLPPSAYEAICSDCGSPGTKQLIDALRVINFFCKHFLKQPCAVARHRDTKVPTQKLESWCIVVYFYFWLLF